MTPVNNMTPAPDMSAEQFEDGRLALGMTARMAAHVFNVTIRSIYRWESGVEDKEGNELPVPGPAGRLMGVLLKNPDAADHLLGDLKNFGK